METEREERVWKIRTSKITLAGVPLDLIDSGWFDAPVNGQTILTAGGEVGFGDDIKVMLPDKISVVLSVAGFLRLRLDQSRMGNTIVLPACVEFHFPEKFNVTLFPDRVLLPAGARIGWPKSGDESSKPFYPVSSRFDPSPLFWLRDGGEIVLPTGAQVVVQ